MSVRAAHLGGARRSSHRLGVIWLWFTMYLEDVFRGHGRRLHGGYDADSSTQHATLHLNTPGMGKRRAPDQPTSVRGRCRSSRRKRVAVGSCSIINVASLCGPLCVCESGERHMLQDPTGKTFRTVRYRTATSSLAVTVSKKEPTIGNSLVLVRRGLARGRRATCVDSTARPHPLRGFDSHRS